MQRYLTVCFFVILLLAGCRQVGSRPEISMLEKQIAMPEEAGAIETYDRFYAEHETQILATFEAVTDRNGSAKWVRYDDLPTHLDGGCGFVYVRFIRKTGKFVDANCGGEG